MSKHARVKERITVKMAKEFLDSRRENQRGVSPRHVAEIADAILMGRWRYNGESIKFDEEGSMIDGQHRCLAAIKAGKSFYADIVYGLPVDSYYTIDQKMKRRSAGDVLKIEGEQNTCQLASALAWHIAYNNQGITSTGKKILISPDAQQLMTELRHHPGIRDSTLYAGRCRHLMGSGPLTFLHYIFTLKDSELADIFFGQLANGENIPRTNPVLYIRKVLLEDKIQNKAKLPIGEKVAYLIKGWNIARNGGTASSVTSIKWTSGGKHPESFPKAK